MKKSFTVLVMVLSLLVPLLGCGGGEPPEEPPAQFVPDDPNPSTTD